MGTHTDTPLLDRLRRHPGGIPALAAAAGVSVASVYALAAGSHKRPPYKLLQAIAPVLGVKPETLAKLWRAAAPTAS